MKLLFCMATWRGSNSALSFLSPSPLGPDLLCCPHSLLLRTDWPSPHSQERQPCAVYIIRFSNPRRKEIFTNRWEKQSEKFQSILKLSVSIVESRGTVCPLLSGFGNKHKWVTNLTKGWQRCVHLGLLRETSSRWVPQQALRVTFSADT